ncbi:hypothetical protein [Pseudonocardia humida]|uniref:Uncharacterized protein n=1 Tax=Pseudonocardia humida TaxID=2800819 RepID=A0ABT1AAI2_9PSEU|nr:hypothetical protein [Pseudonocardia humida]MCO1659961.1 hypothetical protein [Pseudonocardia humida]
MTRTDDRATDSPAQPPLPAVVCDMTDAPDTGEQRLQEYARLFATAFISRERTSTGMRWRLRADDGIEALARDLAARENACCAFMSTTITTTDGEVLWDSTTIDDPAARAVLDLLHELPEARLTDADEVHERFVRTTGVPIVITDGPVTRRATPEEIRGGPTPLES